MFRTATFFFAVFFSLNVHAMSCAKHADCNKWESKNCACGVSAICQGITEQNPSGACQCYGAQGHCKSNEAAASEDDGRELHPAAVRARTRARRAPARRNAVQDNYDGEIQSVEIQRSR